MNTKKKKKKHPYSEYYSEQEFYSDSAASTDASMYVPKYIYFNNFSSFSLALLPVQQHSISVSSIQLATYKE